jgi:hypothetical protein
MSSFRGDVLKKLRKIVGSVLLRESCVKSRWYDNFYCIYNRYPVLLNKTVQKKSDIYTQDMRKKANYDQAIIASKNSVQIIYATQNEMNGLRWIRSQMVKLLLRAAQWNL